MDIIEQLDELGGYIVPEQNKIRWRAMDIIRDLREENQKLRQKIMLLNSMIQTEHEIIRVAALKEDE